MARGDRFKRRLPPFIGRIPDFEDLFIAEDIEFERVDELLKDMGYSLNAHTIPRMKNPQGDLERYEKDYGLVKKGALEDRAQAILRKIRLQSPTTKEAVLNICKSYGFEGAFEERYKEYGFTVWILNPKDFDGSLITAINEAKPAHLAFIIGVCLLKDLRFTTYSGDYIFSSYLCGEELCGDIPWEIKADNKVYTIKAETGVYHGHNDYPMPGDYHYAGEVYDDKVDETIFMQDFDSKDTYRFTD